MTTASSWSGRHGQGGLSGHSEHPERVSQISQHPERVSAHSAQARPQGAQSSQPARLRNFDDDRARVRPVLEACAAQLRVVAREVGIRKIGRSRLRALRTHLAAALAEVDRALGAD